jgi:putative hemolysin/predicted metal-dependent phosphoesterase TrpH
MKKSWIVFIFTITFFVICSGVSAKENNNPDSKTGIANPASVNCVNKGGTLSIQKRGDGGEYGICIFEDNRQCEEWALFRGECPAGGRKVTGYITPAAQYCVITGGSYKVTDQSNIDKEQGICTFNNGKRCDVWDYYSGRCSNIIVEKPQLVPGKSIGNLHMHTTCSDGTNSYEEKVQKALSLKFSFIAITDHFYGGSALCEDVIRQCRNERRLLCIPGMEVTGRTHLLAIGIQNSIDERLPVKKQVEEIHRQGGIAIAAHPFRSTALYAESELFEAGLDAIECKDIPADNEAAFFDKIREHAIHCVSNSDAHDVVVMAASWIMCDGVIRSFDDLKAAMKEKRCGWK